MRNLYLILLAVFTIASCGDDTNLPAPYYPIEGKWLWSPDPDDRTQANTMYEYDDDGLRYTSYPDCWPDQCTDDDFNALDATDRIPGTESYEYDGYSLIIEGIQVIVTFECDGGVMLNENGAKFWRLSSNCQ